MNQTNQTEHLKSEQNGSDFRNCPKSETFGNGTLFKNAEIRTFGFQTLTVLKKICYARSPRFVHRLEFEQHLSLLVFGCGQFDFEVVILLLKLVHLGPPMFNLSSEAIRVQDGNRAYKKKDLKKLGF